MNMCRRLFLCLALLLSVFGQSARAVAELSRSNIQNSIHVVYVLRDVKDHTLVQTMVQVDDPPADMAFDISLRAGDKVLPLGPVAWVKGEIGWWAYDTDLPPNEKEIDLILTPSLAAAKKLKRDDDYRLGRLSEIWRGDPITVSGIHIQDQEIVMCHPNKQTPEAAREDTLEQLAELNPTVKRLIDAGDWRNVRNQIQREMQEHPNDPKAFYNGGCMAAVDEEFAEAMKDFLKVRNLNPSDAVSQQTQHQLRLICGRSQQMAESGDVTAMRILGAAYEHGWGVAQIFDNAKRYYRKAANAGDADSMCRLAAMYGNETGAVIHTEEAHQWYSSQTRDWYRKSASLGNEEAKLWISKHESQ